MDIEIRNDNIYFNVRCSCIIKDKNQSYVLLTYMRGIPGSFMLPGGRINLMENSFECIYREIKEELGLELSYKLISIDEDLDMNNQFHMIDFIFYSEIDSFDLIKNLDDGWDKFKIVKIDDIDNYDVRPSSVKRLIKQDYFNQVEHQFNNNWLSM